MGAGLESHIDAGATCFGSRLLERDSLGMRAATYGGRPAPDDLPGRRNDDAPDVRIGSALAARLFPERNRIGHEAAVLSGRNGAHMPSCFSSFWNCRCRSFCAASLAA